MFVSERGTTTTATEECKAACADRGSRSLGRTVAARVEGTRADSWVPARIGRDFKRKLITDKIRPRITEGLNLFIREAMVGISPQNAGYNVLEEALGTFSTNQSQT